MTGPGREDPRYDTGMRGYPLPMRALYHVVMAILYVCSKLLWRWRVENAARLVSPGATGSVIISNHTSMAEMVVIAAHVWRSGRRLRPLYKSEFNNSSIVGWCFACFGGIPVERETADLKAVRRAQRALQRGEDVFIFPEGTRIRTDDQSVEIHGGFALIAQMAGADVAPMAVTGFRDITPPGRRMFRPLKTWIRCGARLSFAQAPVGCGRRDRLAWMERAAVERMYAIRDELRREHPGRR